MSETLMLLIRFAMGLYITCFYTAVIAFAVWIYIFIVTELYVRENGIHTIAAWLRS